MKRAIYDKEFKIAAVQMGQASDKSVLEVAKELGISGSSLRRWINEYDNMAKVRFHGMGTHFSIPHMR